MIGVVGGGAFGTALSIVEAAEGRDVRLWMRHPRELRPDFLRTQELPSITVTGNIDDLRQADVILLALPTQALAAFLGRHSHSLGGRTLIACCKGVDLQTGRGPTALIAAACPDAKAGILTGPSFAHDIAMGLPTALTLGCTNDTLASRLQALLATPTLRLYRTTDVIGAELGGALKNVIAIACGVAIGAGLGESARAALLTRGYAEMLRFALARGALAETLGGLSGLGDLVLTCTSTQSRNFRFGVGLGSGQTFDPALTVEGIATSRAVAKIAAEKKVAMPVTEMVAALIDGTLDLATAIRAMLSRPLKQE